MNLSSPSCAPRIYGDLPAGSLDRIESVDAGPGADLPEGDIGANDRTLGAASVAVANGGQETVTVVTDDEDLVDWIAGIAAEMGDAEVSILPAASLEHLDRMHACGAVNTLTITAIGDTERVHLLARNLEGQLRDRKLRRLAQMVVAAAARDARRDIADG